MPPADPASLLHPATTNTEVPRGSVASVSPAAAHHGGDGVKASRRPTGYSPSPRPNFNRPTLITRQDVTRYIWGDQESGRVADWIYVSTDLIHLLQFGLPAGGRFTHSPEFRTVFAADEVLFVTEGSMVLANPETGEVVEARSGEAVFFRRDTWHHAFAAGEEPLRVLEFFSPPPASGSSGTYARSRPLLTATRYGRDELLGNPDPRPSEGFRIVRPAAVPLRLEDGVRVAVLASTEHLTVAHLSVDGGVMTGCRAHGGDAVLFGLDEPLHVRIEFDGELGTHEVCPGDALYLPQATAYELFNFGRPATALLGAAPGYLAR